VALWRCGSLRLTDLAASKIRRPWMFGAR
jgi:hypothetical protein